MGSDLSVVARVGDDLELVLLAHLHEVRDGHALRVARDGRLAQRQHRRRLGAHLDQSLRTSARRRRENDIRQDTQPGKLDFRKSKKGNREYIYLKGACARARIGVVSEDTLEIKEKGHATN